MCYAPVSKQRIWQLEKAKEFLLQWRSPQTPVILARNLGRPGQSVSVAMEQKVVLRLLMPLVQREIYQKLSRPKVFSINANYLSLRRKAK